MSRLIDAAPDLLPHIIDRRAKSGYKLPFALTPYSTNPADGFETITYSRLSNAINRAAWWLETNLTRDIETFAYLGANDLRYVVLVQAAMKVSRRILLPSLRNPISAQLSLFEKVGCKTILYDGSLAKSFSPLFAATPDAQHVQVPDLACFLDETLVPVFVWTATLETALKTVCVVVHTSGTSGNPKPILLNHKYVLTVASGNSLPEDGHDGLTSIWKSSIQGQKLLVVLPLFHGGGLCMTWIGILHEMTIVLAHPDVPPTTEYLTQLLQQNVATNILSPPSILEALSKSPEAVSELAKLDHVCYGGGALSQDVGKRLASKLKHLFSFMGATELGWFHLVSGPSDRWDCLRLFPGIGYHFEQFGDELYELVIRRNPKTDRFHGTFEVFPTLEEYRTKDMYQQAAEFPGCYRYKGRTDDLIVLSNGEKIDPIPLEMVLRRHPYINAALVVGEFRFAPCLLVELDENSQLEKEDRETLVEKIWPTVEEANRIAPAFAKISKSLILFTEPAVPFRRAGKGTIQRQLSVVDNSAALDDLYTSVEEGLLVEGLELNDCNDVVAVRAAIKEIFAQTLEVSGLLDDEDVFDHGMDSLRVTVVVQRLKALLRKSEAPIDVSKLDSRLIYANQSVNQTATAVSVLISQAQSNGHDLNNNVPHTREQKIRSMFEKYSAGFPIIEAAVTQNGIKDHPWTVVLTGTTGSLGTYILDALLSLPVLKVAKIYCLNRSSDAELRQKKLSVSRGLRTDWTSDRVTFLTANLGQHNLGLDEEEYLKISREATTVIHNAWKVDFSLTLDSFESQIRGVRNLLDFSASSANYAQVLFVSSISATFKWLSENPTLLAPERVIDDFNAPEELGYGESKYVSERLLEAFSKATGITTTVLRTGQIAGPVSKKGSWPKREWLPSLLASSKHLGVIPATLGSMDTVDWIPVDLLADIIVELAEPLKATGPNSKGEVYNLANPKVVPWSTLLPAVQERLGGPSVVKTVSLEEWVDALDVSAGENHGFIKDSNPAVKLRFFFRGLLQDTASQKGGLRYEVSGLVQESSKAAELEAVSPAWMSTWLDQWAF